MPACLDADRRGLEHGRRAHCDFIAGHCGTLVRLFASSLALLLFAVFIVLCLCLRLQSDSGMAICTGPGYLILLVCGFCAAFMHDVSEMQLATWAPRGVFDCVCARVYCCALRLTVCCELSLFVRCCAELAFVVGVSTVFSFYALTVIRRNR